MSPTWTASMITPVVELGTAPIFRKEIELDPGHGAVTSAALHISSLGIYEAFLNGTPVGDDVLSPGWSSYEWRLRYRSYDVTDLLDDTTVLAVSVGNGWYRGRLGFVGSRAIYGKDLGLIAQLEIDFADGHRQVVVTDESWRAGCSDVLTDDLYDGQTIDAGRRSDTWLRPADAEAWRPGKPLAAFVPVRPLDFDLGTLQPYVGPPVSRQDVVRPTKIWSSPSGRTLVDFGQNLVGWLRFTVRGPQGSEIRIRHAEVLEHDELGVRPLRDAAGHRPVHPQRRRGLLRAHEDLPRLPVRRGQRVARRAHRGRPRGGRRPLRPGAHRLLRVLRAGAQPAAPQRRVGHQGELPRPAHRLPAAQRTARLDRRHRRVRTVRGVPVRRRDLPGRLAGRPGPGAAAPRRDGAVRRPRRPQAPARHPGTSRSRTAPRSGATRPSGCRGRSTRRTATRPCWSGSTTR